jgi:PhnB protein
MRARSPASRDHQSRVAEDERLGKAQPLDCLRRTSLEPASSQTVAAAPSAPEEAVHMNIPPSDVSPRVGLAPWLSMRNSLQALEFYKSAFGAVEAYRMDVPDGVIARLSVDGAEFWLSEGEPDDQTLAALPVGGGSVRMILTVADPDAVFARAVRAGAVEVFPVGDQHGWRLGRVVDPFGLHWEIGRELARGNG